MSMSLICFLGPIEKKKNNDFVSLEANALYVR